MFYFSNFLSVGPTKLINKLKAVCSKLDQFRFQRLKQWFSTFLRLKHLLTSNFCLRHTNFFNTIQKPNSLTKNTHQIDLQQKLQEEGKDTKDIKNWRPITLSNCDPSIITKAISLKTSKVLESLSDCICYRKIGC